MRDPPPVLPYAVHTLYSEAYLLTLAPPVTAVQFAAPPLDVTS
jgi:hypothetical protein